MFRPIERYIFEPNAFPALVQIRQKYIRYGKPIAQRVSLRVRHYRYSQTHRVLRRSYTQRGFTRERVVDHLDRFAYTGHAFTYSLGSDMPMFIDARYSDAPNHFVDLRDESEASSQIDRGRSAPGSGCGQCGQSAGRERIWKSRRHQRFQPFPIRPNQAVPLFEFCSAEKTARFFPR